MTKVVIDKNKSIGKVLYVLEGEHPELDLLDAIFCNILGYEQIDMCGKIEKCVQFKHKDNKYSNVFVVKSRRTDIKGIDLNDDYFDNLHKVLIEDYGFDVDNMAIYYIFDRDRKSNKISDIKNAFAKYKNSRFNGYDMNGLLLLSYPSIESFITMIYEYEKYFFSATEAKAFCNANSIMQIETIGIDKLINATNKLIETIQNIEEKPFYLECIDDFNDTNLNIFEYEESIFSNEGYLALSLLTISLIDLGVVKLAE